MLQLTAVPKSATWLDLLPQEVCDRLAEHVTGGNQTIHALHLALTSQKQTRAVWHSVNKYIVVNFETESGPFAIPGTLQSDDERAAWQHAFSEYPVTISVRHSTPEAVDLLRNGNVNYAQISADDSDLITALCESRSVRGLRLTISRDTDLYQVFGDIESLPLEKLILRETHEARCDNIVPYAKASATLATSFDRLKSFNWEAANNLTDVSRSYWDAIALLPTWTELCFTAPPPEDLLTVLSQFQNIRVIDVPVHVVARLGSAVVGYESYSICAPETLYSEDVMQLTNCPRMKELSIHVDENAQDVLVELVSHLPCLEEIHLSWSKTSHEEGSESVVDLESGLMLSIVTALPKLQSLSLKQGRVPLSEWKPIFTHTDGNLDMLGIEYDLDGPELRALLLNVLSLLPKLCKKMKYLRINCQVQPQPDYEEIATVLHAARKAQMALPTLNDGELVEDLTLLLLPSEDKGDSEDSEDECYS